MRTRGETHADTEEIRHGAVPRRLASPPPAQVDKPVRMLVGFAPGGSADIAARLIAERMKDELKQPVLVENRPGAGGRIVAEAMKNAPADGSVLMLTPMVVRCSRRWCSPSCRTTRPSTSRRSRRSPTSSSRSRSMPAIRRRTMKELVAWYKANPAKANFGSPAPGSLPHFFGLMIGKGAGVELIHVPYNGGAPMMNGADGRPDHGGDRHHGREVELHRAGKIRILGTSGATRSPLLPEVPTFVESGLAGVEGTGWFAVYAPAKTPEATVRQLNAAINKALATPELRERFTKLGLEPTGGSAADLAKRMAQDTARWAPIVKASGFKAD